MFLSCFSLALLVWVVSPFIITFSKDHHGHQLRPWCEVDVGMGLRAGQYSMILTECFESLPGFQIHVNTSVSGGKGFHSRIAWMKYILLWIHEHHLMPHTSLGRGSQQLIFIPFFIIFTILHHLFIFFPLYVFLIDEGGLYFCILTEACSSSHLSALLSLL